MAAARSRLPPWGRTERDDLGKRGRDEPGPPPERRVIERAFGWLMQHRRPARDGVTGESATTRRMAEQVRRQVI